MGLTPRRAHAALGGNDLAAPGGNGGKGGNAVLVGDGGNGGNPGLSGGGTSTGIPGTHGAAGLLFGLPGFNGLI